MAGGLCEVCNVVSMQFISGSSCKLVWRIQWYLETLPIWLIQTPTSKNWINMQALRLELEQYLTSCDHAVYYVYVSQTSVWGLRAPGSLPWRPLTVRWNLLASWSCPRIATWGHLGCPFLQTWAFLLTTQPFHLLIECQQLEGGVRAAKMWNLLQRWYGLPPSRLLSQWGGRLDRMSL